MKHSIAAFALLTVIASASQTMAAELRTHPNVELEHRSQVISFRDLDPTRPIDARELLRRIRSASYRLCWRNHEMRDLHARTDRDACIRESYADAVTHINRRHRVNLEALASRAPSTSRVAVTPSNN